MEWVEHVERMQEYAYTNLGEQTQGKEQHGRLKH
jgi:hypothetical protein